MQPVILIIGTRPEGIKMMPVYFALKKSGIPVLICSTTQHREMLTEVFTMFNVEPDAHLDIMRENQDLFYLTTQVLERTRAFFEKIKPSLVLVQGDTTSTMAAALAAFYLRIPVGHVEAGLRTHDLSNPFPEELNRRFVSVLARYHFAPTQTACTHLRTEGVDPRTIFYTGNTVVDALRIIREKIASGALAVQRQLRDTVTACKAEGKKIVILTAHRRESFEGGIGRILSAIKEYAIAHPNIQVFYPYHPNPKVLATVKHVALAQVPNIYLCPPLPYQDLVYLLSHADVVATDSGGIQEEALSLNKTVLVLREKTERAEGISIGKAILTGTDKEKILETLDAALSCDTADCKEVLPLYGDGYAAEKIIQIILQNNSTSSVFDTPFMQPAYLASKQKEL